MKIEIEIDTNNASELDRKVLALITGSADWPSESGPPAEAEQPKSKPAPPKNSTKPKKEPEPEPEPEPEEAKEVEEAEAEAEETGSDEPTLEDAVERATQKISDGKAQKVKKALEAVGARRVSELKENDIYAFLRTLEREE